MLPSKILGKTHRLILAHFLHFIKKITTLSRLT